ncbi:hypothetical protein [Nocardia sp. NRRL S-836]|uniref:hypothetical protein n=1 Tax=Nocardia sp. NRRL S-836 TaxID=1519492 RepID=UPI0006C596A8|nr:hypothetical protein [Nocardia sp. NRRL S-836]KOV84460.1 hypothetical protein ADL03_16280 [Nocardia sp. NRRL S-836]
MSEQGQAPPPPGAPGDQPRTAQPAADQPTTPHQVPDPAPSETTTTAAPPPVAPARRSRLRGFARHRATQLVAVGLLGLVLGGGIVGAVAADRSDHRGGPGSFRAHDRGERGPDRFDQRGDRSGQRGGGQFEGRPGDRFER